MSNVETEPDLKEASDDVKGLIEALKKENEKFQRKIYQLQAKIVSLENELKIAKKAPNLFVQMQPIGISKNCDNA